MIAELRKLRSAIERHEASTHTRNVGMRRVYNALVGGENGKRGRDEFEDSIDEEDVDFGNLFAGVGEPSAKRPKTDVAADPLVTPWDSSIPSFQGYHLKKAKNPGTDRFSRQEKMNMHQTLLKEGESPDTYVKLSEDLGRSVDDIRSEAKLINDGYRAYHTYKRDYLK